MNARILAPTFDGYLEEGVLIVQDGTFHSVSSFEGATIPPDATIIDLEGSYVIPGLIDMHVHLNEALIPQQLEAFLKYGVTTVREVGGVSERSVRLIEELRQGTRMGPTLLSFGELVDAHPPFWPGISVSPGSEADMQAHVSRISQLGLHGVKFYAGLPIELLDVGIRACEEQGLFTAAHVGDAVRATTAVRAGIGSIEHVYTLTQDLVCEPESARNASFSMHFQLWKDDIERGSASWIETLTTFRDHGAMLVPTLAVTETLAYGNAPFIVSNPALATLPSGAKWSWRASQHTRSWTDHQYDQAQTAFSKMKDFVYDCWQSGVSLGIGSDTPNPFVIPGESLWRECELFQACGIPPSEILRLATQVPAQLFGQSDKWGTLEAGKKADFLVLAADPLDDISALRSLRFTVKSGLRVNPH